MKRMSAFIIFVGLALCCWLIWRQTRKAELADATREQRAVDSWQDSIRLDQRTDYRTAREATPPGLVEEEARQRPQEGRN